MHAQMVSGDLERRHASQAHPSRRCGSRAVPAPMRGPGVLLEWAAVAMVGLALIIASLNLVAPATTDIVDTLPVRVEQGDSLWSLASAHRVHGLTTAQTADLIREINGLSGSVVFAGQLLEVPRPDESQRSYVRR